MKVSREIEEKIAQLQLIEQNLQNFLMQKQTFQSQLIEAESALDELKKSKGDTYRIVGNIMVSSTSKNLQKYLDSKIDILELKIKNIEKQESSLKEKFTQLQANVMKDLKE